MVNSTHFWLISMLAIAYLQPSNSFFQSIGSGQRLIRFRHRNNLEVFPLQNHHLSFLKSLNGADIFIRRNDDSDGSDDDELFFDDSEDEFSHQVDYMSKINKYDPFWNYPQLYFEDGDVFVDANELIFSELSPDDCFQNIWSVTDHPEAFEAYTSAYFDSIQENSIISCSTFYACMIREGVFNSTGVDAMRMKIKERDIGDSIAYLEFVDLVLESKDVVDWESVEYFEEFIQ